MLLLPDLRIMRFTGLVSRGGRDCLPRRVGSILVGRTCQGLACSISTRASRSYGLQVDPSTCETNGIRWLDREQDQ